LLVHDLLLFGTSNAQPTAAELDRAAMQIGPATPVITERAANGLFAIFE
jgi:hypothetical protein